MHPHDHHNRELQDLQLQFDGMSLHGQNNLQLATVAGPQKNIPEFVDLGPTATQLKRLVKGYGTELEGWTLRRQDPGPGNARKTWQKVHRTTTDLSFEDLAAQINEQKRKLRQQPFSARRGRTIADRLQLLATGIQKQIHQLVRDKNVGIYDPKERWEIAYLKTLKTKTGIGLFYEVQEVHTVSIILKRQSRRHLLNNGMVRPVEQFSPNPRLISNGPIIHQGHHNNGHDHHNAPPHLHQRQLNDVGFNSHQPHHFQSGPGQNHHHNVQAIMPAMHTGGPNHVHGGHAHHAPGQNHLPRPNPYPGREPGAIVLPNNAPRQYPSREPNVVILPNGPQRPQRAYPGRDSNLVVLPNGPARAYPGRNPNVVIQPNGPARPHQGYPGPQYPRLPPPIHQQPPHLHNPAQPQRSQNVPHVPHVPQAPSPIHRAGHGVSPVRGTPVIINQQHHDRGPQLEDNDDSSSDDSDSDFDSGSEQTGDTSLSSGSRSPKHRGRRGSFAMQTKIGHGHGHGNRRGEKGYNEYQQLPPNRFGPINRERLELDNELRRVQSQRSPRRRSLSQERIGDRFGYADDRYLAGRDRGIYPQRQLPAHSMRSGSVSSSFDEDIRALAIEQNIFRNRLLRAQTDPYVAGYPPVPALVRRPNPYYGAY